jgi:hypothetical protein
MYIFLAPTFFQSSFNIHLVIVRRKFCGKKVFQKIQDGGWNEKSRLSRYLEFFEKLFSHKICALPTPIECKKKIEKMLDTLRNM